MDAAFGMKMILKKLKKKMHFGHARRYHVICPLQQNNILKFIQLTKQHITQCTTSTSITQKKTASALIYI